LLFQTSISFLFQSLLNNSVFVKGTMAHIYIYMEKTVTRTILLSIDQRVVPFFFIFFFVFFGFFFLLLCIILLNFNSCLLLFFFDRLIDRRLYKTGRCLANSRYLLCFFFLFSIKEIRSYIFNIYINIDYYLKKKKPFLLLDLWLSR
jgi:hypothetical protein